MTLRTWGGGGLARAVSHNAPSIGTGVSPPAIALIANQTTNAGTSFTLTPSVTNPSGVPVSYSATVALPAGLSISSSTGVISGTSTTAGITSSIKIRITYSGGHTVDSNSFSITVSAAWTITTIASQIATVADWFNFTPTVANPDSVSLTYSMVGSLPAGLSINSATGVISGTPSVAATTTGLQLRATNAATVVDSNAFSLQVCAAPSIAAISNASVIQLETLTITPSVTNTDSVAISYDGYGGVIPALPAGIAVNVSTGVITGAASGAAATVSGLKLEAHYGSNLVRIRENFASSYWTTVSSSVSANALIGPDGYATADGIIPASDVSGTTDHGVSSQVAFLSTDDMPTVTASCYFKKGSKDWVFLRFNYLTTGRAWFNVNTGVVGSKEASITSSAISSAGGGWYRCSVVFNQPAARAAANHTFGFYCADADATTTCTGNGSTVGTYAWGATVHAGATLPTYVDRKVSSNAFNIQVKALPTIGTISTLSGTASSSFSFSPTVTNPDSLSITYSISTGTLPTGLSISSSTGAITGTPTTAATTTGLVMRLAFSSSHVDSNAFTIGISGTSQDGYGQPTLGFNLTEMADYQPQFAFNDLMKMARTWTPSSGSLTLNSMGYPTSLAAGQSARLYWISAIPGAGTSAITETHSGSGTLTKVFQDATQMFWDLTATTVGNPLTTISMFIPGTSNTTSIFYQPFLDSLSGFGLLRFMDWNAINVNHIVNWADRTPNGYYTYSGGNNGDLNVSGQANTVPYEVQIALCNETNCDMWMCVPAAASDDYITQLATLIHSTLKSSLKCYYELSNEVWNGSFYGNTYFASLGVSLGYGSSFGAIMKAQSHRSVQMFDLIDAVYGSDKTARRKRVIAGQAASFGGGSIPDQLLSWENAYQKTDYYAIAPYMTVNVAGGSSATTIYNKAFTAGDGYAQNVTWVNGNVTTATGYGVSLAFYEGGPAFANSAGDPSKAGYDALSIDSRMEYLLNVFLDTVWVAAGSRCPFAYYNHIYNAPNAQGFNWGAARHVSDVDTAKYRALNAHKSGSGGSGSGGSTVQAPSFSTITDKSATQNTAFTFTPTVSNPSSLTQSFSISGTLPTGLSISSVDGTISGTPTVVETKTGLSIVDGYSGAATGSVSSNTFQIAVNAPSSGPVAGYTLWLDPSDAATVTLVSSAVSQITDKSGSSHTFAQTTAGSRPPTTTINSLTALSFPFNGYFLQSAAAASTMLSTTAYTVHVVTSVSAISSNATGGTNNNAVWGDVNGQVGLYLKSTGPTAVAVNNDGTEDNATTTIATATAMVLTVQLSGGNIAISRDSGSFTSTASGTNTSLAQILYLGRGEGASPWFNGSIGEVLMYSSALSAGNMTTNINYLRTKWGI